MADLNTAIVEDYSDLGQPIYFTYNGAKYSIGPISPKKAKQLIRMGRKISADSNAYQKKMEAMEEKGEEISDELFDEGDKLFGFQADFISEVLTKYEIDSETKKETKDLISKEEMMEEIEENWTTALVSKIFKRANEILLGEQEKK